MMSRSFFEPLLLLEVSVEGLFTVVSVTLETICARSCENLPSAGLSVNALSVCCASFVDNGSLGGWRCVPRPARSAQSACWRPWEEIGSSRRFCAESQ